AFRANLLDKEVPVKYEVIADRKKYAPDELAGIKADFDPITDELQVQIRDEAKVAASQRRFFIDFDRDVTTRQ
ncbi:MAG: hypothetical protein Q7R96_02755, partial [Nanoarchaeota archaeon]|nr:hypothetical protein [Nanoarchaeota archaeon]